MDVLNNNYEVFSLVEPCATYGSGHYQVRIVAGADVGLIVSALLSIEALMT
jgi:hypothetical protein